MAAFRADGGQAPRPSASTTPRSDRPGARRVARRSTTSGQTAPLNARVGRGLSRTSSSGGSTRCSHLPAERSDCSAIDTLVALPVSRAPRGAAACRRTHFQFSPFSISISARFTGVQSGNVGLEETVAGRAALMFQLTFIDEPDGDRRATTTTSRSTDAIADVSGQDIVDNSMRTGEVPNNFAGCSRVTRIRRDRSSSA